MPIGLAGSIRGSIGFGGSRRAIEPIATACVGYGINLELLAFAAESRIRKHKDQFDSLRDATLECVALSCLLTDENGWYNYKKK